MTNTKPAATVGDRNRRARQRGKSDEYDVARILGGKRHMANTGGAEDVSHERFAIQVKGGGSVVTQTIRDGMASATKAAKGTGKLPLLVCVDRRGGRLKRYAIVELDEFAEWQEIKGATE